MQFPAYYILRYIPVKRIFPNVTTLKGNYPQNDCPSTQLTYSVRIRASIYTHLLSQRLISDGCSPVLPPRHFGQYDHCHPGHLHLVLVSIPNFAPMLSFPVCDWYTVPLPSNVPRRRRRRLCHSFHARIFLCALLHPSFLRFIHHWSKERFWAPRIPEARLYPTSGSTSILHYNERNLATPTGKNGKVSPYLAQG